MERWSIFKIQLLRKILREFLSNIAIIYVMGFKVKYNRVTITVSCVITEKNLYLNLLVGNLLFLWVVI